MTAAAVMLGGLAGMTILMLLFSACLIFLWIYCLIDIIRNDFVNPSNKTIWLLLLIFLAPLGAILYLLIGKDQKIKRAEQIYNKTESKAVHENEKTCRECGKEMKIRKKQSGPDANKTFWVCSAFPNCNGVEEINFQEAERWF